MGSAIEGPEMVFSRVVPAAQAPVGAQQGQYRRAKQTRITTVIQKVKKLIGKH
ncbi:MAG: hypothetical protein ACI8TF_002242 [Paracoccaceae bacterium]